MNGERQRLRIEVGGRVYEFECTDVELRKALHAVDERLARQAEDRLVEEIAIQVHNDLQEERLAALRKQVELLDRWAWEGDAVFEVPKAEEIALEQVTAPWPPKEPGRYTWPEPRRRRGR